MKHIYKSSKSEAKLIVENKNGEVKLSIQINNTQVAGVHLEVDIADKLIESISTFCNDIEYSKNHKKK